MKHIGKFERRDVILLGFSKSASRVIILDPVNILSHDDEWFYSILNGSYAQSHNYLLDAFAREIHPSGESGDAYVIGRIQHTMVPVHEVEIMDKEQAIEWVGTPSRFVPEAGANLAETIRAKSNIGGAPTEAYVPGGIPTDISSYSSPKPSYVAESSHQMPVNRAAPVTTTGEEGMSTDMLMAITQELGRISTRLDDLTSNVGSLHVRIDDTEKALRTVNNTIKTYVGVERKKPGPKPKPKGEVASGKPTGGSTKESGSYASTSGDESRAVNV